MAFATKGTYLNLIMVDAAGNKSALNLALDHADLTALQIADAAGDIDQIITDLAAVTGAQVLTYAFGEKMAEDTAAYGAAGSEVENVALLSSLIDGETSKRTLLRIPAPVDGIFMGVSGKERNIVDVADAALLTYLEHFSTDGEIQISDGEYIADPAVAGNFSGKRIHRSSNRG